MSAKAKLDWCRQETGAVALLRLAAPKPNILDIEMMAELDELVDGLRGEPGLKAVVVSGEGPEFSFGASVEEHLRHRVGATLAALGSLLRRFAAIPAPTLAAVRGRCLGGGFELALSCDLILAEEGAELGCPEIKLGVFPPAAAALLPVRLGAAAAAAAILTGCSWSGLEAARLGLVARTVPDGGLEAGLSAWLESDFLPRSATGLRHAALAVRRPIVHALEQVLPAMERRYLDELMAEPDAEEGLVAFLTRREIPAAAPRRRS